MTVHKVVLTGGPCGGKTSSLEHIKKALSAKGFSVYTVLPLFHSLSLPNLILPYTLTKQ